MYRTVYPRWRGEHIFPFLQNTPDPGLSPLARGTPFGRRPLPAIVRFIPAGAGNTPDQTRHRRHGPVYPRWRGEHRLLVKELGGKYGLSPLARGTW